MTQDPCQGHMGDPGQSSSPSPAPATLRLPGDCPVHCGHQPCSRLSALALCRGYMGWEEGTVQARDGGHVGPSQASASGLPGVTACGLGGCAVTCWPSWPWKAEGWGQSAGATTASCHQGSRSPQEGDAGQLPNGKYEERSPAARALASWGGTGWQPEGGAGSRPRAKRVPCLLWPLSSLGLGPPCSKLLTVPPPQMSYRMSEPEGPQ